jgi:L-ascorbate metabolism protein UlaG (beta-lactamase superfamily)
MKITKYVHSCLLVEEGDRVALIDPGVFSWKSGSFDIDAVDRIDRILVTHPHPDHCFPEFISAVLAKFPEAQVVGSQAVASVLADAGIEVEVRESTQCSVSFEAPHESVESLVGPGTTPLNTGFHFKNQLTHPGDSHSFKTSKRVLAMTFVAPWGSVMDGVDAIMALEDKPEHIIPVHDWFFSEAAQKWLYDILGPRLAKEGITLHALGPAESIEL